MPDNIQITKQISNIRNELHELGVLLKNKEYNTKIRKINYRMASESSVLHFGRLWENAIKITKYLLRHIIGEQKLTFEELYILVTQINFQPITLSSSDSNDLNPLTPDHFLIDVC